MSRLPIVQHIASSIALWTALACWTSAVYADISASGSINPSSPSGWTSSLKGYIGYASDGTLTVDSGSDLSSQIGYIGHVSGASGVAVVSGNGSTWTAAGNLYVGHFGNGLLSIVNGGSVSSGLVISNVAYPDVIGYGSTASGTVTVNGSGSIWTNRTGLCVGQSGCGILSIVNGGTVNSFNSFIGAFNSPGPYSSGKVTVSDTGSAWNISFGLFVKGDGVLNIANGGYVKNTSGYVGYMSTGTSTVSVDRNATWNNEDCLTVGLDGNGIVNITNGGRVSSSAGCVGYYSNSNGVVTVNGPGSTWSSSGDIAVGGDGNGELTITNGGAVLAENTSLNAASLLTMDIGNGSSLTIGNGTGTFTNNGTVRVAAGAGVVPGETYTPISAGTWDGSGIYESFGGTWARTTGQKDYTFTASSVASGSAGSAIDLDLASVQRVLATDSITGKSASVSFLATKESTPISFAATTLGGEALRVLQNDLAAGESILSGWAFSINGYTDGDPVYLSLEVGPGYSSGTLELWHFDGNAWSEFSASDLTYDGTYASFTVTGFSGYAVSAVPEPGAIILLTTGIAGFVTYRLRRRGCRFSSRAFQTRSMKFLGAAVVGLCFCVISGCGGGPSNGDIEAAIKKHFATDMSQPKGMLLPTNPGFRFRFPEGFKGVDVEKCSLAEVSVMKVGSGYARSEMPGLGKLYPVRVFVNGTARSADGKDRVFEGEVDLQVRYAPADQSRVDSGSAAWEVWDAGH
jgi:T5SS/PEP-CTERM-associated repeat protein